MQLKTLTVSLLSAILLGFPQIALSHSSATTVDITRSEEVGDAQVGQFRRISGTLNGNVASSEAVSGLRELADGRSQVPYRTTFELLLPAQPGRVNAVIVVIRPTLRGRLCIVPFYSAPSIAIKGISYRSIKRRMVLICDR